ncbi:sensor histidine kinase [Paenibacillus qinlingensis]|uniref:Two-component system sensor histidine kinase YesM n=1 Tax=Paenibacillus qinlingensis TaxID=1837343 RepID=A0ABU1P1R3_9BACL|nr:sensor histidine kinase [Paenibacillus qinlingensis]MDR6553474.1 two-component system sensor histidine kinase YesM [Paenibacillus qinlingensis]
MLQWFRTLSLRNKLVLTILVCLVLPSIVSMNVSNFFTRDAVRSQVADSARQSMRITSQIVTGQLKNMVYMMNFIQFDEELQKPILSLGHVDETSTIGDIFQAKLTINKRISTVMNPLGNMNVTLLLPNGQYVASYTTINFDPKSFLSKDWMKEVNQIKGYNVHWIGTEFNYNSESTQPYVLAAAKPLGLNGTTYGYVIVGLELSVLQNLFAQYKENETMVIIDENGRILVDQDTSRIGTQFANFDQLPSEEGSSFVKVAGEEYIMQSNQISSNWKLVSMAPYKSAAQQIESFRKTDFLIQLFFLILFAIVLLYVVRTLTKPIAKLVQTVVRIESGQLSERSNISGGDEVGRLGYVFDRMIDRIELTLFENKREQELKRKAELAMLQAQINPHFLFNVLNSIRLKIMMKGDEENAELISSLSALLRMTINRNNEYITLHEEIGINEHYVRLLNSRHGDRVVLRVSAASDTLLIQIPRFLLQPLIENAYIHGLKSKAGEITIVSRIAEDGRLQVEIQDSGVGMTPERLLTLRNHLEATPTTSVVVEASSPSLSGIGIHNVFERLRMIYGLRFDYEIESNLGRGTQIILRFPQQPEKEV